MKQIQVTDDVIKSIFTDLPEVSIDRIVPNEVYVESLHGMDSVPSFNALDLIRRANTLGYKNIVIYIERDADELRVTLELIP